MNSVREMKKYTFIVTQTSFLQVEFGNGDLNTKEGRQKCDVFTKESRENFDVDRIHTWFRNDKSKHNKSVEGEGGRVVLKATVRDDSHERGLLPPAGRQA
jgi:hypothetical protein